MTMLIIREQKISKINFKRYEYLSLTTKYGLNITPKWLKTYLRSFNMLNNELILELFDTKENNVIGILPLVKQKKRDNRFFEFIRLIPCGYRPSDFFPIVVEKGYEKQFSQLLIDWFKNNHNLWDSIYINYIPKNHSIWEELVDGFRSENFKVKVEKKNSFLTIDTSTNYEDYIDSLGSKKAKYLRYITRRIEREIGPIEFLNPKNNLGSYFDEFLTQYSNIKNSLEQSDPFTRVIHLKKFTKEIINEYEDQGFIRLTILRIKEENIAFCYHYYYNGIIYYSMPSYNNDYKKYSPGTILLDFLIKNSFKEENIKEFNFMRSVYDYKLWWRPESNGYIDILINNKLTLKTILNNVLKKISSLF